MRTRRLTEVILAPADQRPSRRTLLGAQALLWVSCLTAGLVGILAASARFACAPGEDGFACQPAATSSGLMLSAGSVLVLAVVLVAVRVSRRAEQRVMMLYAIGTVGGLLCLLGGVLILVSG